MGIHERQKTFFNGVARGEELGLRLSFHAGLTNHSTSMFSPL
jgi:hypothetical protein